MQHLVLTKILKNCEEESQDKSFVAQVSFVKPDTRVCSRKELNQYFTNVGFYLSGP